jgi:hypothetical protein
MPPSQGEWNILKVTINNEEVNLDSQVTAIHAHLIPVPTGTESHPVGKILYFHARFPSNYVNNENEQPPNFVSVLFDPETNGMTQYTIPRFPAATGVDVDPSKLFCSGHTHLADGKLLVAGGERNQPPWGSNGTKYSFLFDPSVLGDPDPQPWKFTKNTGVITKMSRGRWYPQLTRLHDGTVIAMSGYPEEPSTSTPPEYTVIIPERYDPATEIWTPYSDMEDGLQIPLYNGAYVIPFGAWKGEIFYDMVAFGPKLDDWEGAHRFNPFSEVNYWNPVGSQSKPVRLHGCSVLLPISSGDTNIRIINIGGFNIPTSCELIEIGSDPNTDWIPVPDMDHPRHDCPNAMLVADGSLIVIGGGDPETTILVPEMLDYSDPDPSNWSWSELPAMEVPRKYHSTALLLPDGRVWCGGSRIYSDPQNFEFENDMERRIEIYSPGYLFEGARPVITSAPLTINYDEEFEVSYDVTSDPAPEIDSIVLISLPSVTHCYDSNQRYLVLDFELSVNFGALNVTAPVDEYLAPPGYYMLYLLQKKYQSVSGEVRIPSIARIAKTVQA